MADYLQIERLSLGDTALIRVGGGLRNETASELRMVITKALLDTGCVLVDLDHAWIEHCSRGLLFVTALDQAGGWPGAKLVLYGGAPELVRALNSMGVTKTVPHMASFSEALANLTTRPPRVRRRAKLPPQMDSIRRARAVLRDACSDWALPAWSVENAGLVLTELVANAVDHAATVCDVVVEFDGTHLWLSVSDHSRGVPQVRLGDLRAQRGRGLQLVAALSDQWGVEHLRHTKTIWAVVPKSV